MAEIVEYRVEKTLDELNLLVEFGLFTEKHVKEILAKRENFEYVLRRRNRTKLDFLKYIKFEITLLESIDGYRKSVIKDYYSTRSKSDKLEEIDRKILLLQAKKLNDIVRSRSAHISSLFRKLTITFQFDSRLWLAYIEFAKSRNWNSRVTSLYWRLLRVSGNDPKIWLAAAAHEVDVNKAFDTARGLYLRAIRHHPKAAEVWSEYFKMELKFMDIVDHRARIVFKVTNSEDEKKKDESNIWADDLVVQIDENDSDKEEIKSEDETNPIPSMKPIDKDDVIISGHLPKVVYKNALDSLHSNESCQKFITTIMLHILSSKSEAIGLKSLREHILDDLRQRKEAKDERITERLLKSCSDVNLLQEFINSINNENNQDVSPSKRQKIVKQSKMDLLYESYESRGIDDTRKYFEELERLPKNQTLSLYVGMIQVESWQLAKDKSIEQLNRIRFIYDKALLKFGRMNAKLWYEYLRFEQTHAKSLDDFERINRLYSRAQATLEPCMCDRVIEKYTMLQVNSSKTDLEYSDYSDLDD